MASTRSGPASRGLGVEHHLVVLQGQRGQFGDLGGPCLRGGQIADAVGEAEFEAALGRQGLAADQEVAGLSGTHQRDQPADGPFINGHT